MTLQYFDRLKTWPEARRQFAPRLPAETLAALDDAAAFATAYHGDQMRPSIEPVPYVEHLIEVVDVLVHGAGATDRDVLVAALLHDVVEDTPCTEEEVRERFGPRVATLVAWVTKGEDRASYLRSLRDAPLDALLVKLADRVSNVQHLEQFARQVKRGSYYRETVEYILPLAKRPEWFRDWFAAWREEKKAWNPTC
jgi:(p)ppGpp synthase/HD superfamily hydrolase